MISGEKPDETDLGTVCGVAWVFVELGLMPDTQKAR